MLTFFSEDQCTNWEKSLKEISDRYPSTRLDLDELLRQRHPNPIRDLENKDLQQTMDIHRQTLRDLRKNPNRIPLIGLMISSTERYRVSRMIQFIQRVKLIESEQGVGRYLPTSMTREEQNYWNNHYTQKATQNENRTLSPKI